MSGENNTSDRDYNQKFMQLIENVATLTANVSTLSKSVDTVKDSVDKMSDKMTKLDALIVSTSAQEKDVNVLETKVDALESSDAGQAEKIKSMAQVLEAQKAAQKCIEERVASLEGAAGRNLKAVFSTIGKTVLTALTGAVIASLGYIASALAR